jgi:hypothetical protein
MGFEAFRVELRGGPAGCRDVDEAVRKLPHIKPDLHSLLTEGSNYYVFGDGQHIIELEVMDRPVRLSCRFTLCHPSSIDPVFLGLVKELMLQLGMDVKICDDVRPEHARPFGLDEFAEFSKIIAPYVAARRAEWHTAFGAETLAATTNEVHERIIIPQCAPRIGQPT